MPAFIGSIALIRHPEHLEQQWLARWNETRHYYDFVIAKRLGLESWRECLDREIAWVLNLNRSRDYIISSMARLHLEELLPSSEQQNGGLFVVEFFITDLYGKSASTIVDSDPATRWLTSAEVLAGTTADGRTVSPTLVSLLRKADVIAPHTH